MQSIKTVSSKGGFCVKVDAFDFLFGAQDEIVRCAAAGFPPIMRVLSGEKFYFTCEQFAIMYLDYFDNLDFDLLCLGFDEAHVFDGEFAFL